jgi:hypothetical protein
MEAWVEVGTKILVDSGRRLMEVMERIFRLFFNKLRRSGSLRLIR